MKIPCQGKPIVQHERFREISDELKVLFDEAIAGDGAVTLLAGPPKVGCTAVISNLCKDVLPNHLPQLLGRQVVYAQCTPSSSISTLANDILHSAQLDNLKRGSNAERLANICNQLSLSKTKILVLDGAHKLFLNCNFSKEETILAMISKIMNDVGVGVFLVGNSYLIERVGMSESLKSDTTQPIIFEPYSWSKEADQDAFGSVLLALQNYYAEKGFEIDAKYDDVLPCIYAVTAGRVGLLCSIMRRLASRLTGRVSLKEIGYQVQKMKFTTALDLNPFLTGVVDDLSLIETYQATMRNAGLAIEINTAEDALVTYQVPE